MDTTQSGKANGNNSDKGADQAHGLQTKSDGARAREKLMQDMSAVITEAETWLETNAEQSGDGIDEVKGAFVATLETAKSDLLRMQSDMFAGTKRAALATDAYVTANPWQSVGIGAAAGLLIGWIISRK